MLLLILLPAEADREPAWQALRGTGARVAFSFDRDDAGRRLEELKPDALLVPSDPGLRSWLEAQAPAIPLASFGPRSTELPVHAHLDHLGQLEALVDVLEPAARSGDVATVVGFENPFAERHTDPSGGLGFERIPTGLHQLSLDISTDIRPAGVPAERDIVDEPELPPRSRSSRSEPEATGVDVTRIEPEPPPSEAPPTEPPTDRKASPSSGLDTSQLGRRLVERLAAFHERLERLEAHQLLGVDRSASAAVVEQAWFDLAIELHPDRFLMLGDAASRARAVEVVQRLEAARDELLGGLTLPESVPEQGLGLEVGPELDPTWARRAEAAYERGAWQEARFNLVVLAAHAPEEPSIQRALRRVEGRL